jgi:hypothetical protein
MMIINEKTGTIKHLLLNSWLLPSLALAFMAIALTPLIQSCTFFSTSV